MKLQRGHRSAVQVVAISAVLLLTIAYASLSSQDSPSNDLVSDIPAASRRRRLLLLYNNESTENSGCDHPMNKTDNESTENSGCDHPMSKADSCEYVKEHCSDNVELVNYLSLVACCMANVKASRPSYNGGNDSFVTMSMYDCRS